MSAKSVTLGQSCVDQAPEIAAKTPRHLHPPSAEVLAERERCAGIADSLAEKWEASAAKLRKDGSFRTFFGLGPTDVRPAFERNAKDIDAAAHGLRAVAKLIRNGATRA